MTEENQFRNLPEDEFPPDKIEEGTSRGVFVVGQFRKITGLATMPLSRLTLSCSIFENLPEDEFPPDKTEEGTNRSVFFVVQLGKALASGAGSPTATVEIVKKLVGGGGVGDKGDVSSGVLKRH
ncbi:uncharacterized protein RSE6_11988 [Rhynchosporium secalis]|uniref:Uncharacterized protein n=1 Tax=Rhynchosporium secalis TaxID=38038 RepID=A0A1E1MQ85_RHYSE|nr:uncharacterized protein RSE6_11988 [Rhynchosporium secalis]